MAKILIIEDDVALSLSVKALFMQEAFSVETANCGEDGLQMLAFSKYDLVILDGNLPDIDGTAVCKTLRERRDPTRVLMLTGRERIEEKVNGFTSGVDDYLTKPFDPRELLMRARALLRRPEVVLETQIELGQVVLSLTDRTVTTGGSVTHFHKRDFDVLELLMRNPGRYFTPDELLARIWTSEEDAGTAAVRQAILRIRKQLGSCSECLQSSYGHGYRFVQENT